MIKSELTAIVLSDIHLAHKRVPTQFILDNLSTCIFEDKRFRSIDFIYLTGDIFEQGIMLSSGDTKKIQLWIIELLHHCKKYSIRLRVLEGTSSHDRRQSQQFIILNETTNILADVKYYDTLCVDYEPDFGINILYIPDEWKGSTDVSKDEVEAIRVEKNITQFDYIMMHGAFRFQLPVMAASPVHDFDYYNSIVKNYLFIGHIHHMTARDRILVPGSFDRLDHSDEGIKGFYFITTNLVTNTSVIEVVENKNAAIFKTITITPDDTRNDVMEKLAIIKQYSAYPCVNIKVIYDGNKDSESILTGFKHKYSFINWLFKIVNDVTINITEFKPLSVKHHEVVTDKNILHFVEERLKNLKHDQLTINTTLALLAEIKMEV
jgi:hypothetical protein